MISMILRFGMTLAAAAAITNALVAPIPTSQRARAPLCNLLISEPQGYRTPQFTALPMSSNQEENGGRGLPFWLDIGTKGGAVVWSLVLFIVPILGYNVLTGLFGFDELETGKWIGIGFTGFALLAWSSTYLFRVATKDMTYAKQLKDYENAVIAKRLEELDDDEVQALVEEIEREDF